MTTPQPDLSLLRSTKCKNESTSIVFPDTFFFISRTEAAVLRTAVMAIAPQSLIMPPSPESGVLIQTVYRHREQSLAFIQTPKQEY